MDPATLALIFAGIRQASVALGALIVQLEQDGKLTPDQVAEIKQRANVADGEWDAVVNAARQRQGQ